MPSKLWLAYLVCFCHLVFWVPCRMFGWSVRVEKLLEKPDQVDTTTPADDSHRRMLNYIYICTRQTPWATISSRWPALLDHILAHPDSDLSTDEDVG
eukprot:3716755-Amphidinium_carterae.1